MTIDGSSTPSPVQDAVGDLTASPSPESSQIASADLCRRALQAIPAHTAVLDRSGSIILVNDAWTAFACSNGADGSPAVAVGANYLDVCRETAAADIYADQALLGISAVLDSSLPLFEMEYPCHGPVEERWFLMTVAPFPQRDGAIVSHANITARKEAEHKLRLSEERFRATFEYAAVGIAHVAPDGGWFRANRRLCQMIGYAHEDLPGRSFWDIVHPEDRDADDAQVEVMRAGGTDSCRIEQRLLRKDGSVVWVMTTLGCVRTETGAIDYLVVGVEDVSEQKRVEERQQTLLHELSHRGKNLLGVILSIVGRSLSGDRSLAEARDVLIGRLHALANTYETVMTSGFDGALLDVILNNELKSFGDRVQVHGPSIMLTAKATQTIALVAHELATNAAKYGAMSDAGGNLIVAWELAGDETLRFDWREEGGPPAQQPTRRGFGTTLIAQVAGSEFACKPELSYGESGFRYQFTAPLDRLGAPTLDSPVRRRLKNAFVCSLYDTWARQRPAGGLPQLADFDWNQFAATGALTIAKFDSNGDVQFAQIGRALTERLGRSADEIRDLAAEDTNSLTQVYRRCAQAAEPCHELMRIDFGDGDPLMFERLLVPFSATAGSVPSHVVGIVVFEGTTRPAD
jgi:PAS domain S-box-containing protein